jgi:hypothetical protein
MKLLRSLRPLTLEFPTVTDKCEIRSLRSQRFPMYPALKFIGQVDELENQPKRRRFLLLEKHQEVFGVYPDAGTPLEVVRARIVYRLQFEGHRLTGTVPSERFMQNYRAMMRFPQNHFDGCSRETTVLGKLLVLTEGGEVSMSAVNKAKSVAKKVAKANAPKKSTSKREMVLETLSVTESIRYLAKQLNAGADQIEGALKKLGVHAATSTIHAQRHRALKGLLPIPKVSQDQAAKLKASVPPAQKKEPKKVVKAVKSSPKKVIKKLIKAK